MTTDANDRQNSRVIMEILLKDSPVVGHEPEAHYSDAIRIMKPFLLPSEDDKSGLDKIEAMIKQSSLSEVRYPEEMKKVLHSIDTKLQFNLMYMSFIAAQTMHLTDRQCDISRNGISFPSQHHYEEGETILLRTLLPLDPPFISSFSLTTVWSRETPDRSSLPWRVGASFNFRNKYEEIVVDRLIKHYLGGSNI